MPAKLINGLLEQPGTILRKVAVEKSPAVSTRAYITPHKLVVVLENEAWTDDFNFKGAQRRISGNKNSDAKISLAQSTFHVPGKLRLLFYGPKKSLGKAQHEIAGLVLHPSDSAAFQRELDALLGRKPKKG
ncbi:MAG: hypothetical protein WC792_06165 [Candidatus Micrarchaeia archaeon]|jgi:hypothetical protein